jgi:hypothetical protein
MATGAARAMSAPAVRTFATHAAKSAGKAYVFDDR